MAVVEEADLLDPHPDIRALFCYYDELYFDGALGGCTVDWSSSRMTLCAGVCRYGPAGACAIRLSEPLLKYRTSTDLKETLLHEMIHAFLFLTHDNRDHDDHGPRFQAKMREINNCQARDHMRPEKGYAISIYHDFGAEVDLYRTHHWTCERCGNVIRRAQNRPPSIHDCCQKPATLKGPCNPRCQYHSHLRLCGGSYVKTAQPKGYGEKGKGKDAGGGKGKEVGGSGSGSGKGMATRRSSKRKAPESAAELKEGAHAPIESFFPRRSATTAAEVDAHGDRWSPSEKPKRACGEDGNTAAERGKNRKRNRAELEGRGEPTVKIGSHWCEYEGDEDEDIVPLIDKRKERRKQGVEQCKSAAPLVAEGLELCQSPARLVAEGLELCKSPARPVAAVETSEGPDMGEGGSLVTDSDSSGFVRDSPVPHAEAKLTSPEIIVLDDEDVPEHQPSEERANGSSPRASDSTPPYAEPCPSPGGDDDDDRTSSGHSDPPARASGRHSDPPARASGRHSEPPARTFGRRQKAEGFACCPICQQCFPANCTNAKVNAHIDVCLGA